MIIFEKIRYQNLLSTGNVFTEIELNRSGSTLIVGQNGAGKSTFIEALTFALYGRPFRDINKPQLLNTITGKHLIVELEFHTGNKRYQIRRGMKPTLFEVFVDGELVNQNAESKDYQEYLEKQVLKMNFKSFTQIVVLGSANYVPFMKMPAAARRGVVEDLLDIQIFSVMNSLLKQKVGDNKSSTIEIDNQIKMCESKIEIHNKHVDALKANNDELIESKRIKIQEHESTIESNTADTDLLLKQVHDLNEKIADEQAVSDRKQQLVQMETTLEEKVRKLGKEIQFFRDNDNCPTCKQGIDEEFKTSTIHARECKTNDVNKALKQLESAIEKVYNRMDTIADINRQIESLNRSIQTNNQTISFCQRYVRDLNKEIESLQNQITKVDTNTGDADGYKTELKKHTSRKEELAKEKAMHDLAVTLLKDTGIKTRIIKQYVPVMNKLINKYLAAMDFMCDFNLDESFNETIRSRFRDNFTYASFSEGEKARLDLALMFTWRAISKMRNSAATNLLILDEVFDGSLDGNGSDELMRILGNLVSDNNTFVISHKTDSLIDSFENVIRFEKHGNFSRIANQMI